MTRARDVLESFRSLPVVPLDAIVRGPFTVLAPHPDDESLGCGGVIALACARGLSAHVAVLTDGTGSHPNSKAYPAPALAELREREAREAVTALGLPPGRVRFLGTRDTKTPHSGAEFDALADTLAEHLRQTGSETLFSTWRCDPHGDHVAAYLIARAAADRAGARLMSYPVWGWTLEDEDISPATGVRVDITAHLTAKRRAIAAHRSQTSGLIGDDPHGFRLSEAFLALFTGPFEVFLDE